MSGTKPVPVLENYEPLESTERIAELLPDVDRGELSEDELKKSKLVKFLLSIFITQSLN